MASTDGDLDLPTTATSLRAIIFDFNGVIADDEAPHLLRFQQALEESGLSLNRDDYYGRWLGMDERTCAGRKTGSRHLRIGGANVGRQAPVPPLIPANECLVIEDSRAGIRLGLRAGMQVLARLERAVPRAEKPGLGKVVWMVSEGKQPRTARTEYGTPC